MINKFHDARTLHTALLVVICFFFGVQGISASTIDEDEIATRGLVFTPPTDLGSRQRAISARDGFSLLGGVSLFGTTEDNVYRSPELIEQSSSAFGNWLYLRGDTRLSSKTRMLTTLTWTQDAHSRSNIANVRKGSLSNWINFELNKKLKLSADLDIVSENDNAVIITGVPYERDYGYLRASGELTLAWSPNRVHLISISADVQNKNYHETALLNSLDWNQSTIGVRYRLRTTSRTSLRLRYLVGEREYTEELASLLNGDEVTGNPVENHRYRDARISFEYNPSKQSELLLELGRRYRKDLFQGYETWKNSGWRAAYESRLSNVVELGVRISRLRQEYDFMTGDNNALLAYTKLTAGFGGRVMLTPALRLFLAADYYTRDSNKSSGTLYRDYEGTTISLGMSFFLFPGVPVTRP